MLPIVNKEILKEGGKTPLTIAFDSNQEKLVLHLMKNGGRTNPDERQPIGKEMLRKLATDDEFTDEVLVEIVKYLDKVRYNYNRIAIIIAKTYSLLYVIALRL